MNLLGALLLVSLPACEQKETAPKAPPAVNVKVAKVSRSSVPLMKEFIGETKGAIDAEIRARVEGVVTAVHFEEGKEVKEGQLLYSIDPAPFMAKVAEAKGHLAEAETRLAKADSDVKRVRPLTKLKALSERDLDAAEAQQGAAQGAVDAAKAALEVATIELGYCEISSPTSGIIGLTKAKVGEFVGRAPNPIVLDTVSKLDPIHVRFAVTEQYYLYFARLRLKNEEEGKTPQKRPLELILADGSVHSETGELASLEREIDPVKGTIAVEASFPNPRGFLRPGQYAKIRTVAENLTDAIVIPKRAIQELQGQPQVFVVKPDNTVELKSVVLGVEAGAARVVKEGLTGDETIVVEGIQRLRTGTMVAPELIE